MRGVGGAGVRGGSVRGAKEDDVIVFLQLSDIHLDQEYSEVYIIYDYIIITSHCVPKYSTPSCVMSIIFTCLICF